ncbi:MAG: peptidase S16, partial [Pseudomonadota bacterium]|nr:peptidase S16 [Pseudomonadota bacterium]
VEADYRAYGSDLIADVGALDVNRDGLVDVLRRYLEANNMSADWGAIEQSGNEALVNSLSIISPYGLKEKQALLEAESLSERAEILIALTEMVLAQMAMATGSNDNSVQ